MRLGSLRRACAFAVLGLFALLLGAFSTVRADLPQGPVIILTIDSTINPATADYLRTGLSYAAARDAKLVIIRLNTPGGLLSSMQLMVENLLQSKVPTVVFVSPNGAGAMSAGMFITLAGNFAVMSPGTTIGAAHPVLSGGQDITGDMGQKIENFSVSLAKSIAEQRGRNTKWAEEAVRESVAATATEAKSEGVVDFIASDIEHIYAELEGRTVQAGGRNVTFSGLKDSVSEDVPMSLKQRVLNYLADPNIAMLLGMGALLGIAVELYHPGAIFPGMFGAICLVLSLIAGQVLPINVGGVVLMLLGAAFCVAEAFVPSFGALGIVGTICVAFGAIYAVDEDQVFSAAGFQIDRVAIFGGAFFVGACLLYVARIVYKTRSAKVSTGREGLIGQEGRVLTDFEIDSGNRYIGKVRVRGEIWRASISETDSEPPVRNQVVIVLQVGNDMTLVVQRK